MKKKKWVRTSKKKKIIIAGTALVLAGGVAAGAFFLLPKNNGMSMEKNVGGAQSATVSTGSITTTVVGTGNLAVDTATDITIPTGIEIDEVKVESGDTVAKGDVLATVNTDSVKTAMLSAQEEIETIDGELEDAQEDSSYSYVTADVSGTVTAVYAASGEDVTDVMAENGALMTMTLDDDNNTEITITAASGTVSEVYVYEGESISSGDYLFYLSGTSESAAYQELVNERKQLSEKLQKLSALYKSNEIIADFSGIVQNVNVTASSTTNSSTTSGTNTGTSNTAGSGNTTASAASEGTTDGAVVTVAAAKNSSSSDNNVASAVITLTSTSSARIIKTVSATTTDEAEIEEKETKAVESASEEKVVEESTNAETQSVTEDISVTKIKNIVVTPVTGNVPQSQIDETDYYTGSITWNTDEEAYSGGTCYTATVKLKSKTSEDGDYRYIFPQNVEVSQDNADIVVVSVSDTKLEYTVTFAATEVPQSETETEKTTEKTTESSSETIVQSESDTNAQSESGQKESQSGQSESQNGQSESQNGQSESQNGTTGGSTSGASGASGSAGSVSVSGSSGTASGSTSSGTTSNGTTSSSTTSSSASSTTSTNTNEMTAFSVSDDTNMLLAVSVDELDINSVAVGQEATLTFDALEDQEFTGAITSIGTTASVNGGVAKYTVNIEVPKTDDMRVGMNASATITVADAQDILLIPSAALQEKGDKTFVYTSQDETSGELSGEVEVETGLSDGSNVEITSGLSDGDTVYYTRSASSASSSSNSSMQDMMGMMGGSSGGGNYNRGDKSSGNFGGGTPPSGGGAPSGN